MPILDYLIGEHIRKLSFCLSFIFCNLWFQRCIRHLKKH